jgi:uncharacterized membrane protein
MTPAFRAWLLCIALVLSAGCRQAPPEPAAAPEPETDAAAVEPGGMEPGIETGNAGLVPRAFLCRGNEPFWALDITSNSAVLRTPDAETLLVGELKAGETGAYAFRGAVDEDPGEQVAVLMSPGQCFDTMADGPAMPFVALASLTGGVEASGCCTVERGLDLAQAPEFDAAAKKDDDWSRHLPALGVAIERCVMDGGVATDVVTVAWPMNRGLAGVRLRDLGGDRFVCLIDLGDHRIESVSPVDAQDRLPLEGNPLLRPAGETAPILACGRVEQILREDGSLMGHLHYVDGCD